MQRLLREIHWQFVTKTLWLLFAFAARRRVVFLAPPPRRGGFILASNHVSHFDPPLLTISCPRKIDWIAVAELFHGRFLHAFFTGLNVIPVDRSGADRNALRTAVKRLKDGRVVARLGTNDTPQQSDTPKVEPQDWQDNVVTSPHGVTFDAAGNLWETEWNNFGRVLRWNRQ